MRKEFIVSKIEASQDGSPYVYVVFTDPNEPKSAGGHAGSSPEDLMKNLSKSMSNMLRGAGTGTPSDTPTFKISMKEYDDMQLKVGDKVTIEIKRADSSTGV